MGRKYANPPLVEAICEFRLTPETPWDLTVPGLFYERVKDKFPQREQRIVQDVELTQGPQGIYHQIRTSERIILSTEDRRVLVQIGPRLLVINALKPYPGWRGFKPEIEMAWTGLQQVLDEMGLQRIGLRYINRIELPSDSIGLAEYFRFYPFIGEELPGKMVSFMIGAEFACMEGRDFCRTQLKPAAHPEGIRALLLDIDYFLARSGAVEVSKALDWVEDAHSRVEEVFEGCITDRLREVFREVR